VQDASDVMRFFERTWFGKRTGRQLFAEVGAEMPRPSEDCDWSIDAKFDAEDERSKSSGFLQVIVSVRQRGFAMVAEV
jgi:hypothetical protein